VIPVVYYAYGIAAVGIVYLATPAGQDGIQDFGSAVADGFDDFTEGLSDTFSRRGERNWEKGRGDDPYWDKTPAELRDIEKDPNSTPSERERAKRIRKQKEKKRC
jgi:hypothetical protein